MKNLLKTLLLKILYLKHPGCKISGYDPDFRWVDKTFSTEEKLTFAHVGGVGDILFSLYFCRELAASRGEEQFRYLIFAGKNGLPLAAAEFLQPLLAAQKFISGCEIVEKTDEKHIMLNDYRKLKWNFSSADIRSWYYNLSRIHLPREFWKPVIEVNADQKYQDKILLCNTGRYCNVHIDLQRLEPFCEHLVFVGTTGEWREFCSKFFNVDHQPCENMLEMARYMAGSKGFIGNQSGIYSLAECMKIPRILLAPDFVKSDGVIVPGPHNNHPIGGWCEDVVSTEKMIAAVNALLKEGESR